MKGSSHLFGVDQCLAAGRLAGCWKFSAAIAGLTQFVIGENPKVLKLIRERLHLFLSIVRLISVLDQIERRTS